MGDSKDQPADDRTLKAAIAHAWRNEPTPPTLRAKVQAIADEARLPAMGQSPSVDHADASSAQVQPASLRRRRPWFSLAAAAILFIALGIPSYLLLQQRSHAKSTSTLGQELSHALVARHDSCFASSDHHMPALPHDNFMAIGKSLSTRLGYPVLSAPLPGIQWVFYGASICKVEQLCLSHLIFRDGVRDVSVFTLPPSTLADKTSLFESICDHHPVAGFTRGGMTVCLVGSSKDGSLTLSQTRLLRDSLMEELAVESLAGHSRTTLADK